MAKLNKKSILLALYLAVIIGVLAVFYDLFYHVLLSQPAPDVYFFVKGISGIAALFLLFIIFPKLKSWTKHITVAIVGAVAFVIASIVFIPTISAGYTVVLHLAHAFAFFIASLGFEYLQPKECY